MPQATELDDGFDGNFGEDRMSRRTGRRLEAFLGQLMAGDRAGCRDTLRDFMDDGHDAADAMRSLVWPACGLIDALSRRDRIEAVAEHAAIVLLSQLVQRLECGLERQPARGRTVVVASGRAPVEELAGEIFSGLAEAGGFETVFLGGGVESDDLYAEVGRRGPDFVVHFAASGPDAPRLRRFIDAVRTNDPVPGMRIGVGGGVFTRAPGLAEEIGADFSGDSPFELVEAIATLARGGGNAARRARAA